MDKIRKTIKQQHCSLLTAHCSFFFFLFSFFSLLSLSAEEKNSGFFISANGEALGYGWNGMAFGGGASFGFEEGGALGIRFLYAIDNEKISFLEFNIFARLYIFGEKDSSGFFIQLNAGPVIYIDTYQEPNRTGYGNISIGLMTGWRFMLGKNFFIEPALRVGYPYLAGGVIAIGAKL